MNGEFLSSSEQKWDLTEVNLKMEEVRPGNCLEMKSRVGDEDDDGALEALLGGLSPHANALHLGCSANRKKALAMVLLLRRRRKRRNPATKTRVWMRETLKQRPELGEFKLISSLPKHIDLFETYFRLTREQFETLLTRVGPKIAKISTKMRKPIPANERLAICLRYLVTGDPYKTIASYYRVGGATVAKIIPEVSEAIWKSLAGRYMPMPKGNDWEEISGGFLDKWNMPNCVGVLVGRRVVIKKPPMSELSNYPKKFSVSLLAVVDASCRFRLIEVGCMEQTKDEGILSGSLFWKALDEGKLDLPRDSYLPGADDLGPMPQVFVADETFPLKKNILRPFPGKNLSRIQKSVNNHLMGPANLVSETFKILTSHWRIFRRSVDVRPENADWIVKATLVLHNFQRWESPLLEISVLREDVENLGLQDLKRVTEKNASQEALNVRDKFGIHFLAEDKAEEQDYFVGNVY